MYILYILYIHLYIYIYIHIYILIHLICQVWVSFFKLRTPHRELVFGCYILLRFSYQSSYTCKPSDLDRQDFVSLSTYMSESLSLFFSLSYTNTYTYTYTCTHIHTHTHTYTHTHSHTYTHGHFVCMRCLSRFLTARVQNQLL